jgi:predicted NAD-dependent protein-ADP-ribosyltransferase YbiA (DUF1768 family)
MPEEIKPVNQPGFMAPIVPDYSGTNGTIPTSSREIDPYALMEKRLSAIGKPPAETFTELPSTVLPGTGRFEKIFPGEDMEEIYAQGQTWGSKMVNSLGKGLSLTGTTLLQSTVGLANGIYQSFADGRAASFYDNDFNRNLDEFNKELENSLPNYYTQKEKNAEWYSPDKLFTANFFWDGIIKNMGFAAGAAMSGYGYAAGLKALSSLPKMAKLFSVGKAAETLAATEEAILASGKAAETYGKVKSLSDKFLGTYNSLNKGQRILVAGLATTGEAGFEAYQNLNEFRNKKIEEYKEANGGLIPTGADLDKINTEADNVGNSSFLANVALLTATNYIQFPKILGSSTKLEKGILDQTVKEIGDVTKDVTGKYIVASSKYGKALSAINKIRPYTFSASEAFEEGAQYAVSKATDSYYNKKYKGEDVSFVNALTDAIAETIGTTEGMENVLIGGLSGAIMQVRGKYKEGAQKTIDTAKAVELFNNSPISKFTKETRDSVSRGIVLQEEREKKLAAGDTFGSKNSEFDYIINYLTPRIKYGRMDLVQSDIDEYRILASTDDGFNQLVQEGKALPGDTREAYLERLNGLEATAENVKSLYQSLTLRYGNRVLPDGKTPVYNDEVMNKMIYAASKVADYDNRIPQLSSKLSAIGIDPIDIIGDILNNSDEQFNKAIEIIDALKNDKVNPLNDDQIDDLQIALADVAKSSIERKQYIDEYNEIKKNPKQATTEPVTDEEKKAAVQAAIDQAEGVVTKKTVTIETKNKKNEFEIGTEYFLGKVVDYDAQGNEVPRFPKLTILGENEDGTIKIKDGNGNVRDISKDKLLDYKLGNVSAVAGNKTASYYMNHARDVYQYNFGEASKEKKKRGRLEYDPETNKLFFVYKNYKGEIDRKEVDNTHFVAQKDFKEPRIKIVRTLVAETAEQKKAREEFTSPEEVEKTQVTYDQKIAARREVIKEISDDTKKRLERVSNKILAKREQLAKTLEEINELKEFRVKDKYSNVSIVTSFNKILSRSMRGLSKLTTIKNNLEQEIAELEDVKDELEFNLSYFEDFVDNLRELPESFREMVAELKDQVDGIKNLSIATGKEINEMNSLVKSTEKAIRDFADLLKSAFQKFNKDYPDYIRDSFERMKTNPVFEDVKGLKEYVADVALMEDTKKEISINEKFIDDVNDSVKELYDKLNELDKEQRAKEKILEAFEATLAKYEQQQAEEKTMVRRQSLLKRFLGTMANEVQNDIDQKAYEPASKKDDLNVVGGTITAEQNKAHQIRSNQFGNNFHTLENKDDIRGLIVTSNTEEAAAIPGLIAHLTDNGKLASSDTVIALVMVQDNGDGTVTLVDVDGKPIPQGVSGEQLIESAIFQVFPSEKLEATYNGKKESMFRDAVSEERKPIVKALSEQYAAWRDAQLAQTTLGEAQGISASFGIPEYVTYKDQYGKDQRDDNARVAVEDAGLLKGISLEDDRVIEVATTNDTITSDNGSVAFKTPLGRVFMKVPGGLVKLFNTKLTKSKAEAIFKVIKQLATNALNESDTAKSEPLFAWLRNTIYWGIAKDFQTNERKKAGYNNVWFEEVYDENGPITKLFISGKEEPFSIPFTPTDIESNKGDIITLLENLYHNTSATGVNKTSLNDPFFEIIDIDKNGDPITRRWDNYQTYLLSSKGRSVNEIPLTTKLKPIAEGQVNRKGVYFTLNNTPDNYVIPQPAPVVAAPKPVVAQAPAQQAAPAPEVKPATTAPVGVLKLDGVTSNEFPVSTFGSVTYKLNAKALADIMKREGDSFTLTPGVIQELIDKKALDFELDENVVKAFAEAKGKTFEQAQSIIITSIVNKAIPVAQEMNLPQAPQAAPAQTAPVSTDAKTAAEAIDSWSSTQMDGPDDTAYRLQLAKQAKRFTPEDWEKVEAFIKDKLPHIPFYRVKNMIRATNGRQAWGMLHNGAIYVTETAEVGTAYHEVFEAVWKMMTSPEEQKAVLDEFRQRKGSYEDPFTGETIKYSEAKDADIKEKLAEEFRDYVMFGTLPAKATSGKNFIQRVFAEIVNAIKAFFTGEKAQVNTANLFSNIGNGYYREYVPYESNLTYAKQGIIDIEDATGTSESEFRIANIPSVQQHEIMHEMTYSTLRSLVTTDDSLFKVPSLNKKELYARLKEELVSNEKGLIRWKATQYFKDVKEGLITDEEAARKISDLKNLQKHIIEEWPAIVEKHEEYLRTYSIEFDENDNGTLNDESNTGRSDYMDARKMDAFKKANSAIKLLFATLPYTKQVNGETKINRNSTIGGATLIPMDKVFITLKNKLYNAVSIDDMLEKLRQIAINDPNYESLYTRITKTKSAKEKVDYKNLKSDHNIQLLSAFWKSMKSQNPDVKTVFILPSGDVVIGDSNLSSDAKQARQEFFGDVLAKLKSGTPYISYDGVTKTYSSTKAANYTLNPQDLRTYIGFLQGIGIEFKIEDLRKLKADQRAMFVEAVEGLRDSFMRYKGIAEFNKRTLNIDGRLLELGMVKSVLTNPDFESTYFNLNGEPTQTYIGSNPFSNLFDVITRSNKRDELSNTVYKYLNSDVFTKDSSVVLKAIYNKIGNRRTEGKDLLSVGIADGLVNELLGKKKDASKITQKERNVLELNLNLQGWYMNLVPGDASIEWMIKIGNHITKNMMQDGYGDVFEVFKNYFIAEVELAKEGRDIVEIELTEDEKKAGKTERKTTDLRFFKGILGEEMHAALTTEANLSKSSEQLYNENDEKINNAVKKFIETRAISTRRNLERYGIIAYTENGIEVEELNLGENITEQSLSLDMRTMAVNYIIANIELHKIMYSDPYQYKDELKRTKSFQSPRQDLMSSQLVNDTMDQVYNKGYEKGDIGRTDFGRGYFKSTVINDVFSVDDLKGYEKPYEETDGGGYIIMKANRNFRKRNGNWNDNEDLQYRYDIAYEKVVKGLDLTPEEKKFEITKKETSEGKVYYSGKNPDVKSAYTGVKPIVTGSKDDGKSFNDVVVDKFALVPLSFRILHELNPESNAIKLYNKMQKEDVDYAVYGTGRKVGAGQSTALYNADGSFNESPFKETNKIPFEIIGLQSEVPSKDAPTVTQGSQITKLVTLDLMEAGVPIDFELKDGKGNIITDINARFAKWITLSEDEKMKSDIYKEVVNNQKLLEAKIDEGFKTLLNKLGITRTEKGFVLSDVDRMIETLKDEIFKREVNDNISDAFAGFKNGDVVLEATPSYRQIKNILYSIADKNVISPKINGGFKVQVTSALLESNRVESVTINGKQVFKSDVLKFYKDKDGERICEIMVSRWFDNETTKKMSDDELLAYLNTTDEGKKILQGIGFRTPNQKQNSTDAFRIAKFLPKAFGDSVVVPSALVKKAGSDFDIDKLSIYLKNIYFGKDGKPKYVPFFGYGEEGKAKFREMLNNGEFISPEDLDKLKPEQARELDRVIEEERSEIVDTEAGRLLFNLMGGKFDEEIAREFVLANTSEKRKDAIVDILYKKSLENAYMESMQNLVSHPLNFERLTLPNSAKELQDLTKEIVKLTGEEQFDYSSTASMLDREFMSSLRHAFVSGKYAIGIAATSQTNHAQFQRFAGYIDTTKLDQLSPTEKHWLKDAKIKFKEFNEINVEGKGKMATLSMAKNKAGKYISDIIGQFIDGYVDIAKGPWIMQLGASPNVASTWLFLAKVGVPIKTVAYFMNQPIIRDYLASVENAGYSWLFIEDFVNATKAQYKPGTTAVIEEIPSDTDLKDMLGAKDKLNDVQKSQQQFMLDEFLKYAKLSEHLFLVQQGSNFDTATMNDPYLVFKKMLQLKRARGTIISSVDDILESSFVGRLKDVMGDIRDAMATILISDRASDVPGAVSVREVMEAVLSKYLHLNDRDFTKVAQKAVNDLFDWAVQTDSTNKLNTKLKDILLGGETRESAADEIISFVETVKADESHPLNKNYIIQSIKREPGSSKANTPNNLYISGKSNKVYDQNQIIYAFNELKNGLGENKALYQKIVDLAVLQSGLSNSRIAFTTLLPYEDFKEIYNDALFVLDKMPNLRDFYDLNVFERNNWSDSNIIPSKRAKVIKSKKTGRIIYPIELMFFKKPIEAAVNRGDVPRIIKIPLLSREAASDFITYSWDTYTGKGVNKELRKKGDYSYINKGLFKKVYGADGKPLIHETEYDGKIYTSYLYKAINAWGDGFRANEFYNEVRTSEIDNGMIIVKEGVRTVRTPGTLIDTPKKFSGEIEDRVIEKLNGGPQQAPALVQQAPAAVSGEKINIYAGTGENVELSNFANRPFKLSDGITYPTVEHAFQLHKLYDVFASQSSANPVYTEKQMDDIIQKVLKMSAAEAKAFGRTIKGLDGKGWDSVSSQIMKELMYDSFKQNPNALRRLLATGKAELTHTQDKTKWGTEFPKLLMEVRSELANSKTLESLGFSPEEIGKILKSIC